MSLSSLQVLAQNRDALLLAEVAALLHDIGKFTDLHIEHHTTNPTRKWSNDDAYKVVVDNPTSVIQLSQSTANIKKPDILNNILNASSPKAADFLPTALKGDLQSRRVSLLNQDYSLAELIMLGMPGFATHQKRQQLLNGKDGWLPALLGLCHNVAHVDKEDPIGGEQSRPNVLASNAFGYEHQTFILGDPQKSLDARLKQMSFDFTNLSAMRQEISQAFEYGLGDTRRPTNEVSLADWSAIVAAVFKTALAGALLTQTTQAQPEIRQWKNWKDRVIDHDFHWRLLRVNFDVLDLYTKAVKIADLLGYQRIVEEACEQVKKLVEEEYPLGNEIYRDTTGIYFTFPDLDLPADLEQEIRRRVEEVEPELAPRVAVTPGDGATAQEQLKGILAKARKEALQALAQPFDTHTLSPSWQQAWETVQRETEKKWEVCPVCRLRPMAEGKDACEHCLKRRIRRAEVWAKGSLEDTIWLDEVADLHGRLALIVGQFGLDDWLSGKLVQTMLVRAVENKPQDCVPKNPSPARLRRIWETTQRFWQEVAPTQKDLPLAKSLVGQILGKRGYRLKITPDKPLNLGEFHSYELVLNHIRLSVLWDSQNQCFITCDNLDYLAKPEFLGRSVKEALEEAKEKDLQLQLEEPVGYGGKSKVWGKIGVKEVGQLPDTYTPAIPILAEPRTFMAIVPANRAMSVVKAIKTKYEREMGKVRNRLPLTLGVVYFARRTPLAAAIETGRRMLARPPQRKTWEVTSVTPSYSSNSNWPSAICLSLKDAESEIALSIPTVMGDGQTPDFWYPYWRVEGKPRDRIRYFIGPDGEHWVHVTKLQAGDQVEFMPSTFDYEYLDVTARRFEVIYDQDGRRRAPEKCSRPYLLEELQTLEDVWQQLSQNLSTSQVKALESLIEGKRSEWKQAYSFQQADETFRQFVKDVLHEAGIRSETLEQAALRGLIRDAIEFHMTIQKEKTAKD